MTRRLLSIFLVLALAALPARADFGAGGGHVGFWENAPTTIPTILRATCQSSATNATTYDFSGLTFAGVGEGDTVMIVLGIAAEDDATDFSLSSATIEGVAATEVEDAASITTSSLVITGFYRSGNITGAASVDVSVTFSEAVTGAAVCAWASRADHADLNANNADSGWDTASGIMDSTCGGAAGVTGDHYVMTASDATGVSVTMFSLTEREDTTSTEFDFANADREDTEIFPDQATLDWSGSADSVLSCVSF